MNILDRAGDCVLTRLEDDRISVTQADPIIDASVDLLEGCLGDHVGWNGHYFAINAVEGTVLYESVERHNTFGRGYIRMERVA